MKPQEFKSLVEECIRQGKEAGLSDEEILLEFLEQVRFMVVRQMLKVAKEQKE